jgi:hypothetical protein
MSLLSEASAKPPSSAQPYKVAFYSLLILLVAVAACLGLQRGHASEAQAIQKVLEQWQTLDREFKSTLGNRPVNGKDMAAAAEKMKRLDIQDCPPDFREAFIRLAGELRLTGQVMKQYPDLTSIAIDAGLNFLAGEKDAGLSGVKEELNAALRALVIRQTEVEALAVRYGARLLHD